MTAPGAVRGGPRPLARGEAVEVDGHTAIVDEDGPFGILVSVLGGYGSSSMRCEWTRYEGRDVLRRVFRPGLFRPAA